MAISKTAVSILLGMAFGLAQPTIGDTWLPPQQPLEVLPLVATANGLAGAGGERLRAELTDAQFVSVGEDHGFAGPPMLAAALGKELERVKGPPLYHVVEVGPYTTRHASGVLRNHGLVRLDEIVDEQPFFMPFLTNVDDAALALPFAKADRLWGVDQEFIGSAPMLYSLLIARTQDHEVRQQLMNWRDRDKAALSKGKFDQASMNGTDLSSFAGLRRSFTGDEEAQRIIDALVDSARIYKYNFAERYFENNQERARLLTSYFLSQYRSVKGPAPRVLFKMGAYHLGRGITPTSIYDIGSILSGLAAAEGRRSLQIAFIPIGGMVRSISPTTHGFTKVANYDDETVPKLLAGAGIAVETIPAQGWVLIPLEPIRQRMTGKAKRDLTELGRFIVLGYDYLVTSRDAAAATHFEIWTPPPKGAG